MSTARKILLLVGSPKRKKSTSESIGSYLLDQVKNRGMETDKIFVNHAALTQSGMGQLLSQVESADIFVLACPLYIDSLPAPVIRTLEMIAECRKEQNASRRQEFVAIVNSGFPEADQSKTALAICGRFAKEAGFAWAGGLALGGGEAIGGRSIERAGRRTRHVKKALDLLADAIIEGKPVPKQAIALMARPLVPRWLYALIGDVGWRRRAAAEGCRTKLDTRPYA